MAPGLFIVAVTVVLQAPVQRLLLASIDVRTALPTPPRLLTMPVRSDNCLRLSRLASRPSTSRIDGNGVRTQPPGGGRFANQVLTPARLN